MRRTQTAIDLVNISIHALLAESDAGKGPAVKGYRNFYPRSPCGERLGTVAEVAESDSRNKKCPRMIFYFYPRSPCGERLLD